jgi:hypothetical protein
MRKQLGGVKSNIPKAAQTVGFAACGAAMFKLFFMMFEMSGTKV